MFLTRFQLNPQRRGGRKLLASPQAMHAAVLAGFPHPEATEAGRVLWRIDAEDHAVYLYIVSPGRPDLTHLVEQAGWPTTETWTTQSYLPVLDRVQPGQRWAFRLTANPIRVLPPAPGEKRGKRMGHVTPLHQQEWLLQKSESNGFQLTTRVETDALGATRTAVDGLLVGNQLTRRFDRESSSVTLKTVTFDGVCEVTDRDRFVHALTRGIGPAKGYGCGLLTIAPVP
ncbi:type I-E CRISPR-associated protein Cas6/Cse3/CasE [Klugiella xanthotipulae]|uniref:CRISPR-associated Cse3 family protein n=1 Tax=Klugiella xanthotipulae TaxID=244735 RepID=A0A543HH30_9MICO|nr:type I-E CRISPR-associated protein Cas6/Cse3/CasE [Klugiella xanthotipulae]TQM57597.1 CRISPR-associated Cse3 family protein [Klugiella xanthotipulae]